MSDSSQTLTLLAPVAGYILDRVGPRRMAVVGVAIIGCSLLVFWQATTLPLYYAASMLMALGQSLGGSNAFTLAIACRVSSTMVFVAASWSCVSRE